jgi:2-polyprenyl-3-methyl-5-hydroxy-6-metoxy-1,4-benzoquinol methylase
MSSGSCACATNAKPAIVTDHSCRICGNTEGNQSHFPKEMMFGWREEFEYLECGRCGCLQIAGIPSNLAKYYPSEGYYSYKPPKKKHYPDWVLRLRHERTRHFLGERTLIGALAAALSKRSEHFDWFRGRRVTLDSRLLDVGCGAGALLLRLQREGFRFLLGADPFIAADIDYGNGVRILKRGVEELDGQFDFVMLHHSFEHMPDPAAVLRTLSRRLAAGGTLLLRIPVSDCFARKKYGLNWMAWDAPRHLYLHSVKSMQLLAAGAGMEIANIVYDSSIQQFSSSELYIRGVPYVEHGRYRPGNSPGAFSQEKWDEFEKQAAELNQRGEGDTACFYLRNPA